MSTLEVACGRCEKRFRVRAEFAGKSTRCPGCSAPITIGSAPRPAAPVQRPAEPPRPRPRRDDEDDGPRRPAVDWTPVDMAFRREQVAVLFVFVSILCDYFAFCITRGMGPGAQVESPIMALVLLFVVGPSLVAAAFGLMARLAALRTPPESRARTSAVASFLCGLAGVVCLVVLAFSLMMGLDPQRSSELPSTIAVGGLVLAGLGAVATFVGLIAQVGIARRSAAVSMGIGRAGVAVAVCTLVLLGIGILYALLAELTMPTGSLGSPPSRSHESFVMLLSIFLMPLSLGVVLILYHRLLAAGRRAIGGELPERYEG